MQEPFPPRRGRKPLTESQHPLGRLVRERRLAKNWSIAELAAQVGIGSKSISLISEIERGKRAPSLEVAEKLAQVLDVPAGPLVDWAYTRRTPRSLATVKIEHDEYESQGRERLALTLRSTPPSWNAPPTAASSLERAPGQFGSVAGPEQESKDDVPVFGPGADPDGRGARPVAWIARRHVPTSLADTLVRPVAFIVSDEDVERLKRPIHGDRRPRFAVVTRPEIATIDPREPYAVRRHGRVKLAYVAWNGRELLILPPPGTGSFERTSAAGPRGLQHRLVGQVVAMLEWTTGGERVERKPGAQ